MPFLVPRRNVLTETIDSAEEESLDKEVRYSTYQRKRTVLFVVKIVLFALLWAGFLCFFFANAGDGREFQPTPLFLLVPFVAYAIPATICAPYKIRLTKRRLLAVGASVSRWFWAWFFTIFARFWLFVLCPVALFFGAFNDTGNLAITYVVLFVFVMGPFLTSLAYATERVALRKPGASMRKYWRSFICGRDGVLLKR